MRTLFHILFGAAGGFALGVLAPMGLYFALAWLNPEMRKGGGTPFAIMTILTAPAGAVAGGLWGFRRANPPPKIIASGPSHAIEAFERQYGGSSIEEQRAALSEALPRWLDDYRREMRIHMTIAAVLAASVIFAPLLVIFFFLAYLGRVIRDVMSMRAALDTIRARWGDDVIEQCGRLPLTLRPRRQGMVD